MKYFEVKAHDESTYSQIVRQTMQKDKANLKAKGVVEGLLGLTVYDNSLFW